MKQRTIPIVAFLVMLILALPVAATPVWIEDLTEELFSLPDLEVSNPRYYSTDSDSPVIGVPSGIKFDITNRGAGIFDGDTIIWFSSDRYFSDTLPSNVNNIVERRSSYYIIPGQTITVALENCRMWGELDKPGVDHFDFGVRTYVPEEDKINNDGIFKFVVKPK